MTIPSVVNCHIQSEDKRFDGLSLNDNKGQKWLETVKSFRYEPVVGSENKPYTVRKESTKSGDYWYGYRKTKGRLHKKYIGKTSEISTPLLDEIAEDLNIPPQPRVTNKVTEVIERSERVVTDRVIDAVTIEEFAALKSQVQALQESLEALRGELRGKSESGNSEELPTVTKTKLPINLGNLRNENEALRHKLAEVNRYYVDMLQRSVHRVEGLLRENETLRTNQPLADFELPAPADALNRLKAKRKKSKADLGDILTLWEMIEG
ncbi:hypothetical protein QUB33_28650 [Microcoleus sp. B3-A4]|uniref:hypothetical protein n=1 Tax=Microcoleus sp. B3-A4 TaxID=2818653 RepID=UPI002FD312CC